MHTPFDLAMPLLDIFPTNIMKDASKDVSTWMPVPGKNIRNVQSIANESPFSIRWKSLLSRPSAFKDVETFSWYIKSAQKAGHKLLCTMLMLFTHSYTTYVHVHSSTP